MKDAAKQAAIAARLLEKEIRKAAAIAALENQFAGIIFGDLLPQAIEIRRKLESLEIASK